MPGYDTNLLQHIGVLGMKWGRRKSQSTPSADYENVTQLRKKKMHEMSNKEIQAVTTRMNLEIQYKSLNPGKVAKGKKNVDKVLKGIGYVTAASATITAVIPVGKKIIELYKKVLSDKKVAAQIASRLAKI